MFLLNCIACEQHKNSSEFYRNSTTKRGFDTYCKLCRNAYLKARRKGPKREAHLEVRRKWREQNKEKENTRTIAWRQKNSEKVKDYSRKYWQENKEQVQANRKSEWGKKYYENNKKSISKYLAKYYVENKDRILARGKNYLATEAGRLVHRNSQIKRQRSKNGTVVLADLLLLSSKYNRCHFCNSEMNYINGDPKQKTLEHLMPLSRGGAHAIDNLAFSCRSCNLKKGTLTELEFLAKALEGKV